LQFLLGADVAAAPFKSDPTIIAGNSEKGNLYWPEKIASRDVID
jgi:hypothetical protein